MRRFVLCFFAVLVLVSAAFGEGSPAHIVIRNALTCAGGNDEVFVQERDYSGRDFDPPDNPEDYAAVTVLAQEWAALPAPKNTIPTRRYGLMNPYDPVYITTYGDTLEISDWGGDNIYAVRVFDHEGKFITGDSVLNEQHSPLTIKLTSEQQDYYLEFAQARVNYDEPLELTIDTDSSPEYCYVLLRMKAGRERRHKPGAAAVKVPAGLAKDYEASQEVLEDYMLRHGIKSVGDLKADDFVNIAVEQARKDSRPPE